MHVPVHDPGFRVVGIEVEVDLHPGGVRESDRVVSLGLALLLQQRGAELVGWGSALRCEVEAHVDREEVALAQAGKEPGPQQRRLPEARPTEDDGQALTQHPALELGDLALALAIGIIDHSYQRIAQGVFGSGQILQQILRQFLDGGKTWDKALLDDGKLGRYAYRAFRFAYKPTTYGKVTIMAKAINKIGDEQPFAKDIKWNHGGYKYNGIDEVTVEVV